MNKKYLHEYTLRELLLEEEEVSNHPWIPDFIEMPVKKWWKKYQSSAATTATRTEQSNDAKVAQLKAMSPCWKSLIDTKEDFRYITGPQFDAIFGQCPWLKTRLQTPDSAEFRRFKHLVFHIQVMDSENDTELQQRLAHFVAGADNLNANFADKVGLITAIFDFAHHVSDAANVVASNLGKAGLVMRAMKLFLPRDIDHVETQMGSLFAGAGYMQGGTEATYDETQEMSPSLMRDSHLGLQENTIRLWFHTYEEYVLDILLKKPEACMEIQMPREHFDEWYKKLENEIKAAAKQQE